MERCCLNHETGSKNHNHQKGKYHEKIRFSFAHSLRSQRFFRVSVLSADTMSTSGNVLYRTPKTPVIRIYAHDGVNWL